MTAELGHFVEGAELHPGAASRFDALEQAPNVVPAVTEESGGPLT
jgi:hypothetical protein